MRKTFTIDGVDFTECFTPTGMDVSYPKVRGRNSGEMLDGSYTDDVVKTKAVIRQVCMPLTTEQAASLLTILGRTYVMVEYFDPRMNTYREALFMPSDPHLIDRGDGALGTNYWTGAIITFTER